MLKAIVTAGGYTSGNVPLTLSTNTNSKYYLNSDNSISIKTDDLTDIEANIIVTSTVGGDLSLQAIVDGNVIATSTETFAEVGDVHTFHINDIVKTIYQITPVFANLTFTFSNACTLTGGDVIVSYKK